MPGSHLWDVKEDFFAGGGIPLFAAVQGILLPLLVADVVPVPIVSGCQRFVLLLDARYEFFVNCVPEILGMLEHRLGVRILFSEVWNHRTIGAVVQPVVVVGAFLPVFDKFRRDLLRFRGLRLSAAKEKQ